MTRSALPLLFLGAVAIAAAGVVATTTAPPACRLQVIPDYVTPISYRAVLRVSPGCPSGTTLRVRKSSTINTVRNGAPYQPIKPLKGAWDVKKIGDVTVSSVPGFELQTSTITKWQWEYWSAAEWNLRTNTKGRWVAAEVLRAAP